MEYGIVIVLEGFDCGWVGRFSVGYESLKKGGKEVTQLVVEGQMECEVEKKNHGGEHRRAKIVEGCAVKVERRDGRSDKEQ